DAENEMKFQEFEKQLTDQKKLIEEMKRKAEQGSMQLQGEVQELAIEEWLRTNFPFDTIIEIKKGARGADCRHIINSRAKENKGDKMVMLYDYLTGNEFKLQVEGIMEGYTQMQADLETEKRSIVGHWKKREKQLKKVLNNTNFMYNSLRGIAGNAIQTIKVL